MSYLDHLAKIAEEDVAGLRKAQESYGDSWMRRGGVGAFMMLARKWDRLENALKPKVGGKESDVINTLDLAAALDKAVTVQEEHNQWTLPSWKVVPPGQPTAHAEILRRLASGHDAYDIFAAARADQRSEGIIDDIRDLRRYLMLVEAEIRNRGVNPVHRDNLA